MTERRWFGTDGIRGHVGTEPITPDFMLKLGWAAGRAFIGEAGHPVRVVIGKDTRRSGYMFEAALEAGLVAAGADVLMLGPLPTPGVAQLTRSLHADAGIVISASHNPHHDNGIKFFSSRGEKLSDAEEARIEAMIEAPLECVPSESIGRARRIDDAVTRYAEFCKSTVPEDFDLAGLTIVLDCAHGATYQVGPRVFSELGATVSSIGIEPDGLNINREVGSTSPAALQAEVRRLGADLGIAFDGDGDRVQMVTHEGRLIDGDGLLLVLARAHAASGRLRGPVVGTAMSNYALERTMAEADLAFERAAVGDRHVHQRLVERGGVLGGEASGHLLVLDRSGTGDAIVSALQVLEALGSTSLAAALADYQPLPQRTRNVSTRAGRQALSNAGVIEARARADAALAGRGRLVLRPSGTEPVVRVTVESDDEALVDKVLGDLAEAVERAAATA